MSIIYLPLLQVIKNRKIFLFLFLTACLSVAMSSHVAAQVDISRSFMQVLDGDNFRIRNIKTTNGIFQESYSIVGDGYIKISGSTLLEGTNQREYVITERTITIDGNKQDWNGIVPALTDPSGDSINIDPGTDLKGISLAKDQNFLYVLITLYGLPITDGTVTYYFQARLLPEDDCFSYYAGACLISGPSPVIVALHFRPKITAPQNPGREPNTTTLGTFPQFAAYGYGNSEGVVEFKVLLSDFPLEAIIGKYVDAWVEAPPYPSREDTTASEEGVYMEINTIIVPTVNLLLED